MRWIWNLFGITAVGLGIIGVVLPLLPTTPFLLLAAACFAKGSQRLRERLLQARIIGAPLREYLEQRRIARAVRMKAIVMLWSGLALSLWLAEPPMVVMAALLVTGIAVSAWLCLQRGRVVGEEAAASAAASVESDEAVVEADDHPPAVVREQ